MAYIKLTLDHPIVDGESVTFKAPCDSTEVTGIKVYYVTLTETTATELSKVFTFKDAHGNNLSSIGNLFTTGAYVKVVLDTTNGYAYIQNADTNGYIENTMAKKTDVTGKYTKPSTGIPKTDLAEDVQNSLELANTALQSLPSHNHDDRYYTETEINNKLNNYAPAYTYGTTDLTAGTSTLETGKLYFVYE